MKTLLLLVVKQQVYHKTCSRSTLRGLNASKSEYMFIGHRRQLKEIGNDLPDLVLNDEIINLSQDPNTTPSLVEPQ